MRKEVQKRIVRCGQQGYALLMVMFFLALLVLATVVVVPNVLTDVRRQKEEEMIWRGKQYVRGIRLYYTKLHRFPTQLEDLYKPKTGIRFLRQAYKEPMNKADGSWRLIYVGPSGQLIGSTKNRSVTLGGQAAAGFGGPAGPASNSPFGSPAASGFGSSSSSTGMSGMAGQSGNAPGTQKPGSGESSEATDGSGSIQPGNLSDTSSIIGGNIIGVGSKINEKSIIWFDKAKNYRQFEFIWDPSVDPLTGRRVGSMPTNNPSPFGTQPNSNAPNSPLSPTGNPQGNPDQTQPLPTPPNP